LLGVSSKACSGITKVTAAVMVEKATELCSP